MRQEAKRAAVLVVLVTAVYGCQTFLMSNVKSANVADDITPVVARHDRYAKELLTGDDLNAALDASNKVLVMLYDKTNNGYLPKEFGSLLAPVLRDHDRWIEQDKSLDQVSVDVYLNKTRALRALFDIQ